MSSLPGKAQTFSRRLLDSCGRGSSRILAKFPRIHGFGIPARSITAPTTRICMWYSSCTISGVGITERLSRTGIKKEHSDA